MTRNYPEKFTPNIISATIAATRFGYGLSPGLIDRIAADGAINWLISQTKPRQIPDSLAQQPGSAESIREYLAAKGSGEEAWRRFKNRMIAKARQESARHAAFTLKAQNPFRERLIRFWANHFTISIRRPEFAGLVAAFEREAIRPYINGPFSRMLLAVARHPAMLIYLDTASSTGRRTPAGRRNNTGPDENYARELLRLHTLGPGTHYTQKDIVELARVFTGWTVGRNNGAESGKFIFEPRRHDPGAKKIMGKIFPQAGVLEGEAVLDYLARHPITARHLATKMARHFIADAPGAKLIDDMVRAYEKSKGHAMALATGMVDSPAAWNPEPAKLKTPEDLVFSTFNALAIRDDDGRLAIRALETLGQRPYAAPSPAGWPDTASSWITADSLLERLAWSTALAYRNRVRMAPTDQALDILGAQLSKRTYNHMRIADTKNEAIALMLASPEFQRR